MPQYAYVNDIYNIQICNTYIWQAIGVAGTEAGRGAAATEDGSVSKLLDGLRRSLDPDRASDGGPLIYVYAYIRISF
jgi:hypothetical protein